MNRTCVRTRNLFFVPYYNAEIVEDWAVIAKSLLQTDSGNLGL